jgi:hypothetical protein
MLFEVFRFHVFICSINFLISNCVCKNNKAKQPIEFYFMINFSFFVIFNNKKLFLFDHFLGGPMRKNSELNGVFKI